MHTCKQAIDLLLEYLDGEVSCELKKRLDTHLGACRPCEEFVRSYQQTAGLCRKALEARMPKELANKLSDFIRKEVAHKPSKG